MSEYTEVEIVEDPRRGPIAVMRTELGPDGRGSVHEMPLSAIGDRQELLGLATPEEALEAITRLAQAPEIADEIYRDVHAAYGEVVRAEAAAVLASQGRVTRQREDQAQTVLGVDLVSSATRGRLDDARARARSRLGLPQAGEVRAAASAAPEPTSHALRPSADVATRIAQIARERAEVVTEARRALAASHANQARMSGPE